jgi:UDP-N-acetylglucosamine--N-acetylmuramyl-(pentapeptide) pyrophosphoryl-undecaprenol N-acetylglucosamine transferase
MNSPAARNLGLKAVLITGPRNRIDDPGTVELREYEPNLPGLLARTRAIVSRSGAGALADVAAYRLPAVLVPFPFAKGDHQLANARIFADHGAATLIEEKDLTADKLAAMVEDLITDDAKRLRMQENLAAFDHPEAAGEIADHIIDSLREPGVLPAKAPERQIP